MQQSVVDVRVADGTRLCVHEVRPLIDTHRTLVLVHGMGEYAERHVEIWKLFAARGWRVIAPDLRGHGDSGGVRTFVRSFDEYVQDLLTIWERFDLAAEHTALVGNSMGGLISIRFAETHPTRLSALVLLAPLLGSQVPVPWWKFTLGRLLLSVIPTARFHTDLRAYDMTRDVVEQQQWEEDPKIIRSVTAAWYFAMLEALQAAQRQAARIQVPTLVLQGDADRIVDPALVEPWLAKLTVADKQVRMLPGHAHELLKETDHEKIAAFIADWLEPRIHDTVAGMAAG